MLASTLSTLHLCVRFSDLDGHFIHVVQHYSNGHSEMHLGTAIRELKLPRDEIVVMTKVLAQFNSHSMLDNNYVYKVGYYVEGPNKCRLSRKVSRH
jgi:aryl-alcohol dehydrogenase-like predicted oxidoreductase